MILDEEAEILQTEEMFIEDEFVEESVLHTEASSSIASSHDVVVLPNEVTKFKIIVIYLHGSNLLFWGTNRKGLSLTACRPTRDRSAQPMLFLDKVEPLTKTNQLSSGYINRAMEILKTQYPDIGGLFCCTLGGTLEYPQATGRQWMQIVHDASQQWVLVANGFFQENHVLVYDSMAGSNWRSKHILSCMSSLLKTPEKEITYIVKACQRQGNGFDCGVFAIAFATSLANGQDPSGSIRANQCFVFGQ